jgi:hypothetical protein
MTNIRNGIRNPTFYNDKSKLYDKKYVRTTAGSSDEHTYVAPDLFMADTPLGLYQGVTEQVVMSRTPVSFRTVLVPRGSSKAEWEL